MPLLHRLSRIFCPKRRKNEMHVCAPINRLCVLRSPTQALPPTWISLFLTRISNLLSDTLSVCPRNSVHETPKCQVRLSTKPCPRNSKVSGPSVHETPRNSCPRNSVSPRNSVHETPE